MYVEKTTVYAPPYVIAELDYLVATRVGRVCGRRDLNPHALSSTGT